MALTQKTISEPVSFSGIGVHTGNRTTMVCKPAQPDTGIRFVRTDLPGMPVIPADVSHVTSTMRGTTLGINGSSVHTIEHVLASVYVCGITNLIIELNSNEPPVGDGSALPYIRMFESVEIVAQKVPDKAPLVVEEPMWVSHNDMIAVALPSDDYKISYSIAYGHSMLDSQYFSISIDRDSFISEIAPCRTFCFYNEVKELMDTGLIKGGSLDNAVVIGDDAILCKEELRFNDEFVRHKVLDLVGDLCLLQRRIQAHFIAIKSGHSLNIRIAKELRNYIKKKEMGMVSLQTIHKAEPLLDSEKIESILPHRYPFLLVDKIVVLEDDKAAGIKNVTRNEEFFQGHFPGRPIMPGVLIIEALAQVAGVLMLNKSENSGKLAYFMAIDKAKFRKPVVPGDQLVLSVEILKVKSRTGKARGRAFVGDSVAAEAEFMFVLQDME